MLSNFFIFIGVFFLSPSTTPNRDHRFQDGAVDLFVSIYTYLLGAWNHKINARAISESLKKSLYMSKV